MKKTKLLLSMILILMTCTGCTIEYNITINQDSIEEIISVNETFYENATVHDISQYYNKWYPTYVNYIPQGSESIEIEDFSEKVEGVEYHNKSITKITDGYNYTYKYTYPTNKYYDAYTLANTFVDTTIHEGYNTLVLKTSKENLLCNQDYFDTLKVNITIDPKIYKLNYTNTSDVSNNTYTWILDRNNCNDSQIILTLNKVDNKNQDNEIDNSDKKTSFNMYVFYGIFLIFAIIGYLIFKKLKNKNEKFDIDD